MSSTLECIVVDPKKPATACVIWLHGLGDSGAGFAPIVPALNLPHDHQIRFVFPHAPEQAVTLNGGYVMRAWYDIKSLDLHDRADMKGVLDAEQQIITLINQQIALGIPSTHIVLAGFSQGGVMSLFSGLRFPQPLAGIIALSCYLPKKGVLPPQLSPLNCDIPILQQHGEQDDVVPLTLGIAAKTLLVDAGYPVKWQTYPMPHTVISSQLTDIRHWLIDKLRLG